MSLPWRENTALFVSELRQGYDWQALPAMFFRLHGFNVQEPTLTIRRDISEAARWADSVDLIVNQQRIEVKSRRERFTSRSDYPYDTAIIDSVASYDAKREAPLAYVLISRETGAMLSLRGVKDDRWRIVRRFDNRRQLWDHFYVIDRRWLCTLDALVALLTLPGKDSGHAVQEQGADESGVLWGLGPGDEEEG